MLTSRMVPRVQIDAPMAKRVSNLRELTYSISQVPTNRPVSESDMATMLYICAVALSIPRWSAYWMMKVHTII